MFAITCADKRGFFDCYETAGEAGLCPWLVLVCAGFMEILGICVEYSVQPLP